MRRVPVLALGVVIAAATLAACGGGGGSSSVAGPPSIGVGAVPVTPTPSPSPTSSARPASSGRVFDLDSGVPIPGARVVVGPTLILGSTPPPSLPAGDVAATTQADGTYSIAPAPTGSPYVHVFTSNHATLHAQMAAPAPGAAFPDLKVTKPTADELAELTDPSVGLNTVRAQAGVEPVIFDEYALEAARAWSVWEAQNGLYSGFDSSQPSASPNASIFNEYILRNGLFATITTPFLANLAGGSRNDPGTTAMQSWLTEKPSNGPHYGNLVNSTVRWVGFGNVNCAGPSGSGCPTGTESFTQLFVAPPTGA